MTLLIKKRKRKRKTPKNKRYTPEYKEWRNAVKERDGFKCVKCGKKPRCFHIHHIFPYSKSTSLRTNLSNGATLCKKCHKQYHKLYGTTKNVNKTTFILFLGDSDENTN